MKILKPITPQALTERGFKYEIPGIGGQDQWTGMPWWRHENGLILRGSVSSTGRGRILLYPYFNTSIVTLDQLDNLLELFIN